MALRADVSIRVDGDATIGLGHAMRCATLALALREEGAGVEIISQAFPSHLADRLGVSGVPVRALNAGSPIAPLVVIDGYHLAAEARSLANGRRTMMIDDNRELPVEFADLVLNQNLHAAACYPDMAGPTMLLGPHYVLLRPEVVALRGECPGGRILITFGGADPLRLTLPVVKRMAKILPVTVAVGPAHPDRRAIDRLGKRGEDVRLDSGDLITGFGEAEVAAIGGGTTMYETAYLMIPSLVAVVAENQRAGAAAMAEAGIIELVEADADSITDAIVALRSDDARRDAQVRAGSTLIDGLGPKRVAQALLGIG